MTDLDRLVSSRDVCQFLNAHPDARPIRQSTLRTWVVRGKLEVKGRRHGLNLYRLGDVVRLAAARDTPSRIVD